MRGETEAVLYKDAVAPISTHSPHAGRDGANGYTRMLTDISTHSPHAGRDIDQYFSMYGYKHFNPLSPCGERHLPFDFASTLCHFNPLSPCGERPPTLLHFVRKMISTHSPHAGRDVLSLITTLRVIISTHSPHAGRDVLSLITTLRVIISTHSPHAGRDCKCIQLSSEKNCRICTT